MRTLPKLSSVLAVLAMVAGSVALAAAPASAATTYKVQGTDGTLAVQAQPHVDNIIRWLNEGDSVQVICQINNGGTDPYDNLTSHTWDSIVGGGWVYDHFITTPAQDANGWSPGVPRCGVGTSSLNPNAYPWPNAVNPDGSPAWIADGHGYYEGECTSFAAWAIRSDGMSHSKSPDWLGNADSWSGAYVDSAPHAGDILQLFYDGNGEMPTRRTLTRPRPVGPRCPMRATVTFDRQWTAGHAAVPY